MGGTSFCWVVKSDGVSLSNINAQKLGDFPVPFPSEEEQQEIVRRVEAAFAAIDALEESYAAAWAQVDALPGVILGEGVSGGVERAARGGKDTSRRVWSLRRSHFFFYLQIKPPKTMAKPQIVQESHSLVVVGRHNPAIFFPDWFRRHNLIRPEEAQQAQEQGDASPSQVRMVHPDITVLDFGWMNLQVDRERWVAIASQPDSYEETRDLTLGTFRLLRHTPVKAVGINFSFHYKLAEEDFTQFFELLKPNTTWQGLFKDPLPVQLVFQEMAREGPYPGFTRFQVQPSTQVKHGVFIDINDHYELNTTETGLASGAEVDQLLREQWKTSVEHSRRYADQLIEKI